MNATTRVALTGGVATLLAALPLTSVTVQNSWLVSAAVVVGLVVGVGMLARRFGLPRALTPLLQLVAVAWWVGVLVAGDVARFGVLPTTEWAQRLSTVATEGLQAVETYAPPVPLDRGIQLLVVAGVGLVAVAVDLLAVTLRRAPWAGVPLATVYTVPAAVVPGGLSAVWFVPVAAGYLALLVAESRTRVARWGRAIGSTPEQPRAEAETDSLARNGRRVGAIAILTALVVPAVLPGIGDGILGRGGEGGEGGGRTIRTDNPIVDLRRDLVRPDNIVVLEYETQAAEPEYIRSVTLDVFDGTVWRTSDRRVPESQRVDAGLPPPPGLADPPTATVRYDIEVSPRYGSRWLPLPYPAVTIDIDGDWRYDVDTLDVVSPDEGAQAGDYVVEALALDPTAQALQDAGSPPRDLEPLLALPEDLPALVGELTEEVTAEADDDFAAAAALQAFFRSEGDFGYDLSVPAGNSTNDLLAFLEERRGYCEQFAATMAIMARVVGIPSRVAVGFLPGETIEGGIYEVRAHDAHAWPELYFEGVGWVRFEPTPGQRTGGAPSWSVPPVESEAPDAAPVPAPTTSAGAAAPNPRLADRALEQAGGLAGAAPGARSWWPWALVAVAVLGSLALPAAAARSRRGMRWRRAASDPARAAEAAWADLRDASRDAGLSWDAAASPRAAGVLIAERTVLDEEGEAALAEVVHATEQGRYARTAGPVPGLRGSADRLRRTLRRSSPRRRRMVSRLWPAATSDLVRASAERVADGLDWADSGGERVRERLRRVRPRRRR